MPTLGEIALASPANQRRAKDLTKALNDYAAEQIDKGRDETGFYSFPNRGSTPETLELADDVMQVVHQAYWDNAAVIDGKKDRYFKGSPSKVVQAVFDLYSDRAAHGLVKHMNSTLARVGRIVYVKGKTSRGTFEVWVRDPSGKFKKPDSYQWQPSRRAAAEIEEQAQKAVVLAGDVNSKYDIDMIPTPDPNPESVMEYIKKMRKAAHGMAGRIDALEKALQEANAKLDEYADAIESAKAADEWGKVVQAIEDEKAR